MPGKYKNYKKKGLNKVEKKQVLSLVNKGRENKYYDTLLAEAPLHDGVVYSISDIPQGDTDVTRDGDQIVQRALRLRGKVIYADATNLVRYIVFRWKQDDVPTVSDILSTTYVGTKHAPYSPFHHDGRTNFTVLYDKLISVDTYNPQRTFDSGWLNLKGKKTYFIGGGINGKNKLYTLIITDSQAIGNPSLDVVSRLTFTDS